MNNLNTFFLNDLLSTLDFRSSLILKFCGYGNTITKIESFYPKVNILDFPEVQEIDEYYMDMIDYSRKIIKLRNLIKFSKYFDLKRFYHSKYGTFGYFRDIKNMRFLPGYKVSDIFSSILIAEHLDDIEGFPDNVTSVYIKENSKEILKLKQLEQISMNVFKLDLDFTEMKNLKLFRCILRKAVKVCFSDSLELLELINVDSESIYVNNLPKGLRKLKLKNFIVDKLDQQKLEKLSLISCHIKSCDLPSLTKLNIDDGNYENLPLENIESLSIGVLLSFPFERLVKLKELKLMSRFDRNVLFLDNIQRIKYLKIYHEVKYCCNIEEESLDLNHLRCLRKLKVNSLDHIKFENTKIKKLIVTDVVNPNDVPDSVIKIKCKNLTFEKFMKVVFI